MTKKDYKTPEVTILGNINEKTLTSTTGTTADNPGAPSNRTS